MGGAVIQEILAKWMYVNGVVCWRVRPYTKTAQVGDPVAFLEKKSGHRVVSMWFDGKTHKLQYARVVWLLVHGEFPAQEIDHIDRNPANNSIDNLRLADRCENNWNRSLTKTMGVHKHGSCWRAEIVARKKKHRISGFNSKEDAVEFRELAAAMLHGEFANTMSYATA